MFQGLSSVISGILMSKMSWLGKVGINFLYKEYAVLKVWWKSALIMLGAQLVLILVLWVMKMINNKLGIIFSLLTFLAAIAGIYFTYIDFTTTNHKVMKEQFHFGAYLFWASWIITCIYFIFTPFRKKISTINTDTLSPDN